MATLGRPWQAGDPLENTEQLLLEHSAGGQVFDGTDAGSQVAVRGEVLRHLLTTADWPVDPKGVRLRRVRIHGLLDLEAVTVRCPVLLADCEFDDSRPLIANFATIPLLALRRCRLSGFSGDSLTVSGNLSFRETEVAGPLIVSGARIGGALQCGGTRIGADATGTSLACHGMNVRLSVHLNRGFTASGAIVMPRAEIGGEFLCQDARLGRNEHGASLYAPGMRSGGAIYLNEGFTAAGAVRLSGGIVGGQLSCAGASIGADADGNSLLCDGMRIGGSVNLDADPAGNVFTAAGAIRLAGTEITGSLTCRGAQLGANSYGNALVADELRTTVAVLLEDGFAAAGSVRLTGADIRGQLRCDGIQITGADQDGCSLDCSGIRVGGRVHLAGGFRATGAIALSGADLGGTLRLTAAQLGADTRQRSLAADGIRASRDLILDEVTFAGGILLEGASIAGMLNCRGARLGANQWQNSVTAGQLTIGGDVNLVSVVTAGAVLLPGARIDGLLTCRGAHLAANSYGNALNGNGSKIGRAILLSRTPEGQAFAAEGMVQLAAAETAGSLHCEGGELTGQSPDRAGLLADGMKIGVPEGSHDRRGTELGTSQPGWRRGQSRRSPRPVPCR